MTSCLTSHLLAILYLTLILTPSYNDQSQRICSSDMSKCIFEIWDGVMHIYAEGQVSFTLIIWTLSLIHLAIFYSQRGISKKSI